MNQSIDISIAKLSAPVEMLDLDRRAWRALRRAGIYTVAELILMGKPKPGSIRKMGTSTAERIWAATTEYLGLTGSGSAWENISPSGCCQETLDVPVSALPLSPCSLQKLTWMGYSRIKELVKARANDYGSLSGLGAKERFEIDQLLHSYLARAAQAYLLRTLGGKKVRKAAEASSGPCPAQTFQLPRLTNQAWLIFECRGLRMMSLREIGASLGYASGQQVSDIIRQTRDMLQETLNHLSGFLDQFEERSGVLQQSLNRTPLELNTLVQHLSASYPMIDETEVERLVLLLRTLALHPGTLFWQKLTPRWPRLILLSCLVEPSLTAHEQVREILADRQG